MLLREPAMACFHRDSAVKEFLKTDWCAVRFALERRVGSSCKRQVKMIFLYPFGNSKSLMHNQLDYG